MGAGFSLEEYNDLKYNVKQKQLMSYLNFHKNILKYIGIILIVIINYCIYYTFCSKGSKKRGKDRKKIKESSN